MYTERIQLLLEYVDRLTKVNHCGVYLENEIREAVDELRKEFNLNKCKRCR